MSRLLVHIATGPENPTRAALGLPAAMAPPDRLVELAFGADRVLVY